MPLYNGRQKPKCPDFGPGWHYLFQGQGFSCFAPLVTCGMLSLLMHERAYIDSLHDMLAFQAMIASLIHHRLLSYYPMKYIILFSFHLLFAT
jgi:hypothetical protein